MTETGPDTPSPEYSPEMVRAAMERAVSDILHNVPATQTVATLATMGFDPETAAAIYGQVRVSIKRSRKRSAIFLMGAGAFWLIACLVAWLMTHFACATFKPGLGRTILLLAAIAIVQLVAGYFRWRRAARL